MRTSKGICAPSEKAGDLRRDATLTALVDPLTAAPVAKTATLTMSQTK